MLVYSVRDLSPLDPLAYEFSGRHSLGPNQNVWKLSAKSSQALCENRVFLYSWGMRKTVRLIWVGASLLVLFPVFAIWGNAIHESARCISSFEGQDSLLCKASGSSILTIIFLGLSFVGFLLAVTGLIKYFRGASKKGVR